MKLFWLLKEAGGRAGKGAFGIWAPGGGFLSGLGIQHSLERPQGFKSWPPFVPYVFAGNEGFKTAAQLKIQRRPWQRASIDPEAVGEMNTVLQALSAANSINEKAKIYACHYSLCTFSSSSFSPSCLTKSPVSRMTAS